MTDPNQAKLNRVKIVGARATAKTLEHQIATALESGDTDHADVLIERLDRIKSRIAALSGSPPDTPQS